MFDIVIVNWNSGPQLQACIGSVRDYGGGLVDRLIVVDNGSVDGSADAVQMAPDVQLVLLGKNVGFGAACNRGAALGDASQILFLNPDAMLYPDTLERVADYLRKAPDDVGIVGAQLINDAGTIERTCSRFPSASRIVFDSLGFSKLCTRNGMKMKDWDHKKSRTVDQVIGAFFVIKRGLFEALDGFDERYFVYFEEVDLSYRLRLAGYRSWYLAEARAYHKGGGVSDKVKAHRLFYSLRSRILFARKHFTSARALIVVGASLGPEFLTRAALLVVLVRWSELSDLWRGYRLLWLWAARSQAGRRPTDGDRSAA